MRASGRGRERCGCPGSGAWALPAPDPLAVLAVHGLLGDAEPPGDVLPGPPELPRVLDLDDLQPLGECSQGRHGAEPDIRIGAGGALGDFECGFHARQHMLTPVFMSTYADDPRSASRSLGERRC